MTMTIYISMAVIAALGFTISAVVHFHERRKHRRIVKRLIEAGPLTITPSKITVMPRRAIDCQRLRMAA